MNEIKDGDRNTKYFHHKLPRKSRNLIKGLFDSLATGARKMMIRRGFMIGYFTSLFSSSSLFKGASQAMLDVVAPIIAEQMNADFLPEDARRKRCGML